MASGPTAAIFMLVRQALTAANPGYSDVPEVARFVAAGSPLHIAAHWIEEAAWAPSRDYSCLHLHDSLTEVNVLLGEPGGLEYAVVLSNDAEPTIVESPCAILIPPGVSHSANVLRGRGWFVVLRLPAATAAAASASPP